MPDNETPNAPQIVPGAVRTASVVLAAEITSTAAGLGFDISDRVANIAGFVVAIGAYVTLRWKELNGKGWATRVLGLGMKSTPAFTKPPTPDE